MARLLQAGVVILALACGPVALQGSSFTDSDIEKTEAKAAFQAALAENKVLKRELSEARQAIKSLSESLAVSNTEAEEARKELAQMRQLVTALGVEGLSGDKKKIDQKLLSALSDWRLVQEEKDKLADELILLSEAVMRYVKSATSDDAEARMALEARVRSAEEALALPGMNAPERRSLQGSLTDAMVVSLNEKLSLVVANIGSRQGVRVGMPFKVVREGKIIGHVKAVDVRERIFGAVIHSLESEKNKIKVGDRLMVETQ